MSITLRTRLKVSSVSSIKGSDGQDKIKITFVEIRNSPPMVAMIPQNTPKEISNVVLQVQKGLQQVIPRGLSEFQKIVLVFTPEELEAFQVKPYPNQIYEVTISNGVLKFKIISL